MNKLIRLLAAALLLLACGPAFAQSAITHLNKSVSITTGNTYQLIETTNTARRVVEIENNNTADNCFIEVLCTESRIFAS